MENAFQIYFSQLYRQTLALKSDHPREHKRAPTNRDTTLYKKISLKPAKVLDEEMFDIGFAKDTGSKNCYGCQQKFRDKESSSHPPPLYDLVLDVKELRLFSITDSHIIRW